MLVGDEPLPRFHVGSNTNSIILPRAFARTLSSTCFPQRRFVQCPRKISERLSRLEFYSTVILNGLCIKYRNANVISWLPSIPSKVRYVPVSWNFEGDSSGIFTELLAHGCRSGLGNQTGIYFSRSFRKEIRTI